jgi:tetratricopeptide (TPR) repeat protein
MDLLLPLDRIEEALHEVRVAETSDPLSPTTQAMLAYVLISAGQYDEAAERCQKLPADYRQKSQCLGRARLGQGRIDEAIQVLTAADEPGYLGYAYGRAGRREEAEELAAASRDNFDKVLIFAGLGDKDRTLQFLDRMTRLGPFRVGRMLTFPELALLRGDPRVKDLRRKAGLPD